MDPQRLPQARVDLARAEYASPSTFPVIVPDDPAIRPIAPSDVLKLARRSTQRGDFSD